MIKVVLKYRWLMVLAVWGVARMTAAEGPNLVIILTDDQGYHDVGFNGCEDIPTPNIDRIAAEGVRFTEGYVTYSVCSPSRAGLLTGRYQGRFGFRRNPSLNPRDEQAGLAIGEETMADILGKVGYHSGIIGKWHLGTHPQFRPLQRGFDEFYGFVAGGHNYFPSDLVYPTIESVDKWDGWYKTKVLRNEAPVETDEYLTDELSNEAVSFISRNAGKPFFLYLAYNAPHTPLQATRRYLERFQHIEDETRRTYAAMVSAVDDGVGRVLDTLELNGLVENTIVVFLSDNGGAGNNGSSNVPLRAGKGDVYEGGVRVPFAMRWPGQIPAGLDYEEAVSSLDILATMVARVGVDISEERPLDGVDILPFLKGEQSGAPHETLFWEMFDRRALAIRSGDQKLVLHEKENKVELFNLDDDLAESRNVAEQDRTAVDSLSEQLEAWKTQLQPPAFEGRRAWDPSKD